MKLQMTYRFRIYPNVAQRELIEKNFGAYRFVYNFFLEKWIRAYREGEATPNRFEQYKELPELKRQKPWLKEVDSTSLQAAVKSLYVAYQHFFDGRRFGKNIGLPKRKRKRDLEQSYKSKNIDSGIRIVDGKHLRLPKVGNVRCAISKQVPENSILYALVKRHGTGKYYVSLCCKPQYSDIEKTGKKVGLIMKRDGSITTSDGELFSVRNAKNSDSTLQYLRNNMTRKPRASISRQKCAIKYSTCLDKRKNQMTDDLNKITTQLIKAYDFICIGNLSPKIRKCVPLNELVWMLKFKAELYGRIVKLGDVISIEGMTADEQAIELAGEVLQKELAKTA